MPFPTPPTNPDSFDSSNASIPTGRSFGDSATTTADSYGSGVSAVYEYPSIEISPLYFPYATNYQQTLKLKSEAGGSTIDVPFAPSVILADAALGNLTLTLPSARNFNGKTVTIMRYDTSANTVTIAAAEGSIRQTASVSSILGTQYGAVDYTASFWFDLTGIAADDVLWIGR